MFQPFDSIRPGRLLLCLALALALAAPALGAGGYRSSKKKSSPLAKVEKALEAERYDEALEMLASLREKRPEDADVWNLTGYARRKLGRFDEARAAYDRALAIDPDHKRAHEYLGELFLQTGDLAAAEGQLAKLDELCRWPCKEEKMLREEIERFRADGSDAD